MTQFTMIRNPRPIRHTGRSPRAEMLDEFQALLLRYPRFVTSSRGPGRGEIPVFVFHTIEPETFSAQLQYLVENGYRTVSMAEFIGVMSGEHRGSGREVLITIDDARSSTWLYALPLLRKFGCRATVFAITGWTPETAGTRPNLDSGASRAELATVDPGDQEMCTWDELRAMQDSGYVDIESHTHRHARVFSSAVIYDYFGPESPAVGFNCSAAPYIATHPYPARFNLQGLHGAPLMPTQPSTAGNAHLEVPDEVVLRFTRIYQESLGTGLAGDSLRNHVYQQMREALRGLPPPRVIDAGEAYRRLREELDLARRTLVERLGNPAAGTTMCVPFTLGSERTIAAAREIGLRAVFWGSESGRRINAPDMDPLRSVRLKNDFIHRLPGRGRCSLPGVYLGKARRRMQGSSGY